MSMNNDLSKEVIPENDDDYDKIVEEVFDEKYGRSKFVVRRVKKEQKDTHQDDATDALQETLYFKRRTEDLGLDKNIGSRFNVQKDAHKSEHGGFYCQLCDTHVWDSNAWLDHINGKKHNRLLGMNNKVEKVGIEDIQAKLQNLKQQKLSKNKAYDLLVQDINDEEQAHRKIKNQNDRKKIKTDKDSHQITNSKDENDQDKDKTNESLKQKEGEEKDDKNKEGEEEDEDEEEEEDPNAAMMAMLGLPSSFQVSKSKK